MRGQEQRLKTEPEAVREKRMSWCRGVHPLSRQTRRPSSPARALTLALVPIPCFGVEIFRNFDNVRVKMRSRDCKPWIRFVLETCACEYEYAYHIFLDFIIPFSKKFLFSEGMISGNECININFAFFSFLDWI